MGAIGDDYVVDLGLMAVTGEELLFDHGNERIVQIVLDQIDGAAAESRRP